MSGTFPGMGHTLEMRHLQSDTRKGIEWGMEGEERALQLHMWFSSGKWLCSYMKRKKVEHQVW